MGNCCRSPASVAREDVKPNYHHDKATSATAGGGGGGGGGLKKLVVLNNGTDVSKAGIEEKYILDRELGRGEFGVTYLCMDRDTRDLLACKSISKRKLRTAVDIEDVRREVDIMRHLPRSTSIVILKEACEDDQAVHLVMELCEGGELFDRIVARGHYTERAAAAVMKTIVEVVQHCHRHGVIHRDLKPENFLFANKKENSPLKAIDFGLSIFFKPRERFSEIVGSPYYMAPEVLKRNYGPEIDIWSAGVILYILLCGVPPFWAESDPICRSMASRERELLEVYEAARKAADAAEENGNPADVDRCVDALRRLREVPVTVKVLVDTQVGKKLRSHLTKHPVKKIQKTASDLCELWKKKVIEETSKKKENSSEERGSVKVELRSVNADTLKVRKASGDTVGSSRSETVKVEKISHDQSSGVNGTIHRETALVEKITREEKRPSDKKPFHSTNQLPKFTSVIKCNDAIRDKTRELFAEALSKVSGEARDDIRDEVEACDPMRVAIVLESVMFEKLGRSNSTHKQKYRSILFNLKDQNNPDLRRRVLLGEIKPEDIINLTAEEMASDERKLLNKQIKEKALFECERGLAAKASTDQFKCGRCGQRKCTYYQMQTRSADEPMTTYVTCVNCNNHWKFC